MVISPPASFFIPLRDSYFRFFTEQIQGPSGPSAQAIPAPKKRREPTSFPSPGPHSLVLSLAVDQINKSIALARSSYNPQYNGASA